MAQQEIPEQWRKAVCAALASGDAALIYWEPTGRKRYEAIPGCDWAYEAHDAFRHYLLQLHPTGCHKVMDVPPGETYDFFFQFKGRKFYGKILLRTDRRRIVVFSAHLPAFAKLSCEMDD
jgi:hypothetical protein